MPIHVVKADASDFARVANGYRVGGKLFEVAAVRAINRGGDAGLTQVRQAVMAATGISAKDTRRSKGLARKLATAASPSYRVQAQSQYTPLAYFNPVQTAAGVRATPWNRSQLFAGTFTLRMSSGYVGVFRRDTTAAREVITTRSGRKMTARPIKELWGPSLAVEVMRNGIPQLFERTVMQKSMERLPHELQFAMDKAMGKKK